MSRHPRSIPPPADEVTALYLEGKSVTDICAYYAQRGRFTSDSPIKRILRERGVMRSRTDGVRRKRLKYAVDEAVFERIDTTAKAWALGWWFSDGYNRQDQADARVSLHSKDEEVLVKLARVVGTDRPLMREPKYRRITLIVSRRKVTDDLARLGCVQAKGPIIEFPYPALSTREITCAFLRGFIEGDGCIHVTTRSKQREPGVAITIACSSLPFIAELAKVFTEYWNVPHHLCRRKVSRKVYAIRFRGTRAQIRAMLMEIYNLDSLGLYLERKHLKYQQAIRLLDHLIATHRQSRADSSILDRVVAGVSTPSPLS